MTCTATDIIALLNLRPASRGRPLSRDLARRRARRRTGRRARRSTFCWPRASAPTGTGSMPRRSGTGMRARPLELEISADGQTLDGASRSDRTSPAGARPQSDRSARRTGRPPAALGAWTLVGCTVSPGFRVLRLRAGRTRTGSRPADTIERALAWSSPSFSSCSPPRPCMRSGTPSSRGRQTAMSRMAAVVLGHVPIAACGHASSWPAPDPASWPYLVRRRHAAHRLSAVPARVLPDRRPDPGLSDCPRHGAHAGRRHLRPVPGGRAERRREIAGRHHHRRRHPQPRAWRARATGCAIRTCGPARLRHRLLHRRLFPDRRPGRAGRPARRSASTPGWRWSTRPCSPRSWRWPGLAC